MSTYAESAAFVATGLPAWTLVRCPCCGKRRPADGIVRVADAPADVRARVLAAPRARWREWPEYACGPALNDLRRHGLATLPEIRGGGA